MDCGPEGGWPSPSKRQLWKSPVVLCNRGTAQPRGEMSRGTNGPFDIDVVSQSFVPIRQHALPPGGLAFRE